MTDAAPPSPSKPEAAAPQPDTAAEPSPDKPDSGDAEEPDAAGAEKPDTAKETNEPAGPSAADLLSLVRKKKTSDADARKHLDEAQKLGANPRDLAKSANARGQDLMASPDRATPFFEYARQIDAKFPDATFNLAKFAANRGEIPKVKELLTEVAARGGKKLLDTIEFDPTFALVADDRDIQALK